MSDRPFRANQLGVPRGRALPQMQTQMHLKLRHHRTKEEDVLSPILERRVTGLVTPPICVLQPRHGADAGRQMKVIRRTVSPAHACRLWRRLCAAAGTFAGRPNRPFGVENTTLQSQFDSALARELKGVKQ